MKKALLTILGLLIVLPIYQTFAKESDFRNARWGMTKTEVKQLENSILRFENDNSLFYNGVRIKYLEFELLYRFTNNKLTSAYYSSITEHTNKNDYISDYKTLKTLLTQKYGEPIEDKVVWKDDLYKGDNEEGFAVSVGHLFYYANWETESTEVDLTLWGNNYEVKLMLSYSGKEFKKLEEEKEKEKTLDDL